MTLTIVAHFKTKPDKADFVEAELKKLIPLTLAEKGCINYDLHKDNSDPVHFMFYENWDSRDLWQNHMNSAHLKEFVEATKDALAEDIMVYEMTKMP